MADAIGLAAGDLTGFAQAAYRLPSETVGLLGDALDFGRRMARPKSPEGQAALSSVRQVGGQALGAARYLSDHPEVALQGAAQAAHDLAARVKPDIRPTDPDAADQVRRNFEVGKRGGDLQFQGGMLALPALRGLGAARALTREELIAKFLGQKFSLKDAEYLAEPYPWPGHHAIPRRTRIPEAIYGFPVPAALVGKPLPKAFMDSPFNLVKPKGISRGEFYELHAKVDPNFHAARWLPDSGKWTDKTLGIKDYDPVRRVWYGTPTATKKAVAGASAGAVTAAGLAYPERPRGTRK